MAVAGPIFQNSVDCIQTVRLGPRQGEWRCHKEGPLRHPTGISTDIPTSTQIRVVRVLALGDRRGTASEVAALYEELAENVDTDTVRLPARRSS